MATSKINIDFNEMEKAFPEHIRKKAIEAGSNIIYVENNQLIKENPAVKEKLILISCLSKK